MLPTSIITKIYMDIDVIQLKKNIVNFREDSSSIIFYIVQLHLLGFDRFFFFF